MAQLQWAVASTSIHHEGKEAAFQNVFKVWSAMTKTLRTLVLKYVDDDIVLKTAYFGKFWVPKIDRKVYGINRPIVFQPPSALAKACSQVA